MLPDEFTPGMRKLVAAFSPRGWNADAEDVYWDAFRDWTVGRWDEAVQRAIHTSKYMPKVAELMDLVGQEKGKVTEPWPETGCGECFQGLLWREVERVTVVENKRYARRYEKAFACVCAAGDRAARVMWLAGKNKYPDSRPDDYRWREVAPWS